MNRQDRLEDLLVDWVRRRQEGQELTAADICTDDPDFTEDLSRLINDFKATDWLEDVDDSDDDFLSLPDFSTLSNRADETGLPECNLTVKEFCQRLVESGLMEQEQVDQFQQRFNTDNARAFARQLVEDKKLTTFQATVLLEGRDIPLVLDRYVLLDEIGAGGMGAVYKALHQQMDRVVALKILPKEAVDSEDKVRRFQREVKAAAKLEHPNIVTAFDAREDKGYHFLVMSLVNGSDLSAVVRKQGPLSVARAVDYIAQAARGLEHAHQLGIVHRDIKPGNLLLSNKGKVKILDMGLARIDAGEVHDDHTVSMELTEAGAVMGTVAYLPPEQALDTRTADARSDLYSLGCTLYFLLTGKPIYVEDTMMKTLMAHREQEIPSLCGVRKQVPNELDAIFQRMVAKSPEDRFQSMTELLSAMETLEIEDDDPTLPLVTGSQAYQDTATFVDTSRDVIEPEPAVVGGRQRRWGWMVVGLLLLAGLGGAWAAGIFLKVDTPAGTIVLEIDQPELAGAVVSVDGEKKITITTGEGQEPIEVSADEKKHTLKVVKGGFETFTKEFSVKAGGKQTIEVRLEPLKESVAASPEEGEWDDRRVAEWVLSIGGWVTTNNKEYRQGDSLPATPFRNTLVSLPLDGFDDGELSRLTSLRSLKTLLIGFVGLKTTSPTRKPGLSDAGLAKIGNLQGLKVLSIAQPKGNVSDGGIVEIRRLQNLELLGIHGPTSVTHAGIAQLSSLPNLKQLDFKPNEGVCAGLNNFKHLTRLSVCFGIVDDSDATHLKKLSNLVYLDVCGTQITNTGLTCFAELMNLKVLNCGSTRISDVGLKSLKNLEKLSSLDLHGTNITDDGMAHLKSLHTLRELNLHSTKVTAQGVATLQKALPNCKIAHESLGSTDTGEWDDRKVAEWVLSIGGWIQTDKSGGQITNVGQLPNQPFQIHTVYIIDNQHVTGVSMERIKGLTKLTRLSVRRSNFGDEDAENLKGLLNLRELYLSETPFGDPGMEYIKGLTEIRRLGLSCSRISDMGLENLKELTNLTELGLSTSTVSGPGLEYLKRMTKLTTLHLQRTQINDEGVQHLVQLTNLTWLDLRGTKVTAQGIADLQKALPNCKITWDGNVTPDRTVAESVLEIGGSIETDKGKFISFDDLPGEPFQVIKIDVSGSELVEDDDLEQFKGLTKLAALDLSKTNVTAEGVAKLQKTLPNCKIEHESLSTPDPTEWDDRKVAEWVLSVGGDVQLIRHGSIEPGDELPKESVQIFRLVLPYDGFVDDELSRLLKLNQIKQIGLGGIGGAVRSTTIPEPKMGLTDAGLVHIGKLKTLEVVEIRWRHSLTDAGVTHLRQLENLKALKIHKKDDKESKSIQISDEGIAVLAGLPKLIELGIEQQGGRFTGSGLRNFANLEVLMLVGEGIRLNQEGLQAISQLNKLKYLRLQIREIDDNVLLHCKNLTGLERLVAYTGGFDSSSKITDAGVKHLTGMTGLKELNISESRLTDACLPDLMKFTNLTLLRLASTKVTPQGVASLQKALPNCKIEHDFTEEEIKAAAEGLKTEEKSEPAPQESKAKPDED